MKLIYVASALENAKICKDLAAHLRALCHTVTSSWHDVDIDLRAKENGPLTDEQREEIAAINHQDVIRANTLVVLYDTRCRSTLFEAGSAYASGHRVIVIGSKREVPIMLAQRGIVFVTSITEVEKHL